MNSEEEEIDEVSIDEDDWLLEHVKDGTCPLCKGPQAACNHLVAEVDVTFGTFDRGSLRGLYNDIVSATEADEEHDSPLAVRICGFLEENCSGPNLNVLHADDSEAVGMRPMSASACTWVWARDVEKVREVVRNEFLATKRSDAQSTGRKRPRIRHSGRRDS